VSLSAETAADILWPVWYVTWIAAVVWSARTKAQMKTDIVGPGRWLAGLGSCLLFAPSHLGRGPWKLGPFDVLFRKYWVEPSWAAWSLFVLIVAGFAFCWWARLHLGRLWSGFVTVKEDHRVVDTGPYGLVRHPIYAGVIFSGFVMALLRASPASLIGSAMFAAGFAMIAAIEERFLREQLGADAYDAYSRRVPMLVPMTR
jgi:protein-S-isoprenylcysteine O-methyltransferase Ste14